LLVRYRLHFPRRPELRRDRFLDDHMLACAQCADDRRKMIMLDGHDTHQVDVVARPDLVWSLVLADVPESFRESREAFRTPITDSHDFNIR
jgi:hypothetical protein